MTFGERFGLLCICLLFFGIGIMVGWGTWGEPAQVVSHQRIQIHQLAPGFYQVKP